MRSSIETRPPFLDKNLVNFAKKIALEAHHDPIYGEKAVLKKAYEDRIPRNLLIRRKFPYRAPDSLCFSNDYGRMYVLDRLDNMASSVIDVKKFRQFCEPLLSKTNISPRENHAFMVVFSAIIVEQIINDAPIDVGSIKADQRTFATNSGEIIYYENCVAA